MTAIQNLSDEAFLAFIFCIPRKKYPVTQTHFLTRDFDHPSFPPSFLRFGRPFSRPLARRQTDKRKKEKEGGRGSLAHTARSTTITAQATDGSGRTEEMGGREGGRDGRAAAFLEIGRREFFAPLVKGEGGGRRGCFYCLFFLSFPSLRSLPIRQWLLLRSLNPSSSSFSRSRLASLVDGKEERSVRLKTPTRGEGGEILHFFFAPSIAAFFFP